MTKPAPRPATPAELKAWLDAILAQGKPHIGASNPHRGICASWLDALFVSDAPKVRTEKRHVLLDYLIGKPTTKGMTVDQAKALISWAILDGSRDAEGRSKTDALSAVEAGRVVRAAKECKGENHNDSK